MDKNTSDLKMTARRSRGTVGSEESPLLGSCESSCRKGTWGGQKGISGIVPSGSSTQGDGDRTSLPSGDWCPVAVPSSGRALARRTARSGTQRSSPGAAWRGPTPSLQDKGMGPTLKQPREEGDHVLGWGAAKPMLFVLLQERKNTVLPL